MTAGILDILGVDMGNVRAPDSENPKGYFEDRDFSKLTSDIFVRGRAGSDGFNPPTRDEILRVVSEFDEQARKLLHEKASASKGQLWGWKTNGTCLTAPLYLRHLKQPKMIIVFRNMLAISRSAVRYTKHKSSLYKPLNKFNALRVAHQYHDSIISLLEEYPELDVLFVSFEEIVSSPIREAEKIASFLELELTGDAKERIARFVGFTQRQKLIKHARRFEGFMRKNIPQRVKNMVRKFKPTK